MRWISDRWHDFLVLLRLRPDFRNPDNAPPAFWDREPPHPFKRGEGLLVCMQCGGGRLHKVHGTKAYVNYLADNASPPAEASLQNPARFPFPIETDQGQ